ADAYCRSGAARVVCWSAAGREYVRGSRRGGRRRHQDSAWVLSSAQKGRLVVLKLGAGALPFLIGWAVARISLSAIRGRASRIAPRSAAYPGYLLPATCCLAVVAHMPGHQVGAAKGADVGNTFGHLPHLGLEGVVVHVAPVARFAACLAVVLGGGGVEVAEGFQLRRVRQGVADIHIVLQVVPEGAGLGGAAAGGDEVGHIDPDVPVAMDDAQHVVGQALAIRRGGDIGIEFVEGRDLLADGAVFLVFAVIVVIEDGNQPGAAVELPQRASGGFDPELREMVYYKPA